jgi:hypothetical protein
MVPFQQSLACHKKKEYFALSKKCLNVVPQKMMLQKRNVFQ